VVVEDILRLPVPLALVGALSQTVPRIVYSGIIVWRCRWWCCHPIWLPLVSGRCCKAMCGPVSLRLPSHVWRWHWDHGPILFSPMLCRHRCPVYRQGFHLLSLLSFSLGIGGTRGICNSATTSTPLTTDGIARTRTGVGESSNLTATLVAKLSSTFTGSTFRMVSNPLLSILESQSQQIEDGQTKNVLGMKRVMHICTRLEMCQSGPNHSFGQRRPKRKDSHMIATGDAFDEISTT